MEQDSHPEAEVVERRIETYQRLERDVRQTRELLAKTLKTTLTLAGATLATEAAGAHSAAILLGMSSAIAAVLAGVEACELRWGRRDLSRIEGQVRELAKRLPPLPSDSGGTD